MNRPTLIVLFVLVAVAPAPAKDAASAFVAVESLHAAATSIGMSLPIDDLIVSSAAIGSAPEGAEPWLIEQAAANNLSAVAVRGWTSADLRTSPSPFVAFVRAAPDVEKTAYAVFVEAVGDDDVTARVGRIGPVTIPLGAWSELWDGAGVVIDLSDRAADSRAQRVKATVMLIIAGTAVATVFGIMSIVRRSRKLELGPAAPFTAHRSEWRKSWAPAAVQSIGLISISALIGWTVQRHDPARSLADGVLIATVHESVSIDLSTPSAPVYKAEVHEIDTRQFRSWLANETPLLVDARDAASFGTRRIADSIGLATFGPSTVRLALAGVPRDQLIVVYCSDLSCPRGHQASAVLERSGFTNVYLYPPGWEELQNWRVFEFATGDPSA